MECVCFAIISEYRYVVQSAFFSPEQNDRMAALKLGHNSTHTIVVRKMPCCELTGRQVSVFKYSRHSPWQCATTWQAPFGRCHNFTRVREHSRYARNRCRRTVGTTFVDALTKALVNWKWNRDRYCFLFCDDNSRHPHHPSYSKDSNNQYQKPKYPKYLFHTLETSEKVRYEAGASRICSVARIGYESDMDLSVSKRAEMMGRILPQRSRAGLLQRSHE